MKRSIIIAVMAVGLSACAGRYTTPQVAPTGGGSDGNNPVITEPSPLDFFGQFRQLVTGSPEKRAFVLGDLNSALLMAQQHNEVDGLTCLPVLISCVNDVNQCGSQQITLGYFSLKEARNVGMDVKSLVIPPKIHSACAAWFTDSGLLGRAILKAFGGK